MLMTSRTELCSSLKHIAIVGCIKQRKTNLLQESRDVVGELSSNQTDGHSFLREILFTLGHKAGIKRLLNKESEVVL